MRTVFVMAAYLTAMARSVLLVDKELTKISLAEISTDADAWAAALLKTSKLAKENSLDE